MVIRRYRCWIDFAYDRRTPPLSITMFFFFNDTASHRIYTLSLHDALPISGAAAVGAQSHQTRHGHQAGPGPLRSEEHTSELQSRQYLVCRLLLEKKNTTLTMSSCIIIITTQP